MRDWNETIDIIEELPDVSVQPYLTYGPDRKIGASLSHKVEIANGAVLRGISATGETWGDAVENLYSNLIHLAQDECIAIDPMGDRTYWLPNGRDGWRMLSRDEVDERFAKDSV